MTPPIKERLTSRKFWLTVAVFLLIVFSEQLGISLETHEVLALAAALFGYNLGNGLQKR